jgi:hypothetical protein
LIAAALILMVGSILQAGQGRAKAAGQSQVDLAANDLYQKKIDPPGG